MTNYSEFSTSAIRAELAQRELARRRFSEFFKYTVEPKGYIVKDFHRVIADKLQQVHAGTIKRLMLFVPPQHGKTTLSTECFPAWYLGKEPDTRIIVGAYSADYASKLNRTIQRLMTGQEYRHLFPDSRLNEKNVSTDAHGSYLRNSTVFEVVGYTGSVRTAGRDGGVTGNPADLLIFDDFIKNKEEANSGTLRNKMWEGYEADFETRMHNDSRVVFTITRWHDDDVAGRLLKRDGEVKDGGLWDVVRFEAIKEREQDYDSREMGEPLFPERHGLNRLLKIKNDSPSMFQALYQQDPTTPGGNIIKEHFFKTYNLADLPDGVNHMYVDTATSEKELTDNDPTGILVFRPVNGRIYLIDFVKGMWGMGELPKAIKDIAGKYFTQKSKVVIENKSNGRSTQQVLRDNTNLSVVLENPVGKKMERVENELPGLETGRVMVPAYASWVKPFIEQCAGFPSLKHDEEVDCLTGAMRVGLPRIQNQGGGRKAAVV